jgi:hypothetical protein
MANGLDDRVLDQNSFAWRDITGQEAWEAFTPVFGALTVVGATNYAGRMRRVGRSVEFQVRFSAATSIASVAGTDYLNLPVTANSQSFAGIATMTNDNSNIAVGVCHIDVATSRCYLPTQVASNNVFTLCGSYEV